MGPPLFSDGGSSLRSPIILATYNPLRERLLPDPLSYIVSRARRRCLF